MLNLDLLDIIHDMGLEDIFSKCPIRKYQNPSTTKDAMTSLDAVDLNNRERTRRLIDQYQDYIDREKAKKRGEKLIGQG